MSVGVRGGGHGVCPADEAVQPISLRSGHFILSRIRKTNRPSEASDSEGRG